MLQVVLTNGEVVDIDGDAVTFAGPWAGSTRGPIPVASVSAEGVVRIKFPSDAADRRRTTIGVSVKAWQPWTEEEDADLADPCSEKCGRPLRVTSEKGLPGGHPNSKPSTGPAAPTATPTAAAATSGAPNGSGGPPSRPLRRRPAQGSTI
jgi:hypothetical protein